MKSTIFFTVLMAILSLACPQTDTEESMSNKKTDSKMPTNTEILYKPANGQKEEILIYLDLSTSIDDESVKSVAAKIKNYLMRVPSHSEINFRILDKNIYADSPFPTIVSPLQDNVKETTIKREEKEAERKWLKQTKDYEAQIDEVLTKIQNYPIEKKQNTSCIINTIEAAYDFFKSKNKNEYQFRLVYFSDMVEQCTEKNRSIYVCSDTGAPIKDSIISQIDKNYSPNFNLNELIGNKISVIITNNVMNDVNSKCLPSTELKQVWEKVFSKVGYAKSDFETFNFTQDVVTK